MHAHKLNVVALIVAVTVYMYGCIIIYVIRNQEIFCEI